MKIRYQVFPIVTMAFLLSACASKPEILPSSGPHSPTTADQVEIYQKEPKRYEKLGGVSVSRDEGAVWDDRGDATVGFDLLKRKAAALGANGLLLKAEEGKDEHRKILAGYHGEYYQVPVSTSTPPHGMAQAIFVRAEDKEKEKEKK
jgi:hypothetical protein